MVCAWTVCFGAEIRLIGEVGLKNGVGVSGYQSLKAIYYYRSPYLVLLLT